MKCCRYCCYAAKLIDRDNRNNKYRLLFCSKLGMTVNEGRYDCIYFQRPLYLNKTPN